MIALAIVLAVVTGALLGAFGSRFLIRRELDTFRTVAHVARESSGRANDAAARVEAIVPEWPRVLEAAEDVEGLARRATLDAKSALAIANETDGRMDQLEHEIARNFSIVLTKGSS